MNLAAMKLMEGYHRLRHESSLAKDAAHLEGKRWRYAKGQISRSWAGWVLRVYRCGKSIEACLIAPDGTSRTYA